MNFLTYEHKHATQFIESTLLKEVSDSIRDCQTRLVKGKIPELRVELQTKLTDKGWSPEVQIDPTSKISITSIKNSIGLCIQTGNMARIYADLLKLQTVFQKGTIQAGVFILPEKIAAKNLGDNIANFDRLKRELHIFQEAISIPLVVFGFS